MTSISKPNLEACHYLDVLNVIFKYNMDLYDTLCKSMIFLILSGTMYTIAILPNLQYIFYTQWGILLLVKIFLVLFVVIVGGLLCYSMKKKKVGSIKRFFKIDIMIVSAHVVVFPVDVMQGAYEWK